MRNILVSACLLGVNCRYNGVIKANKNVMELLEREDIHLIPVCPEQLGGLSTPRNPSEIQPTGCILMNDGRDVTREYNRGAEETLKIAELFQCDIALLKERSPSCGYGNVYDGSFSGTLTEGDGITAGLLIQHAIDVFGESELDQLIELLEDEEAGDIAEAVYQKIVQANIWIPYGEIEKQVQSRRIKIINKIRKQSGTEQL